VAIARVGSIQAGEGVAANTLTTTGIVIASGANQVAVFRIHVEDATTTIASVVWNGASASLLAVAAPTSWARTAIYIIKNPTAATGDLVTTTSGTTHVKHTVELLSGVDQTTTNRTSQTAAANTGTSITTTVPSVVSGDYVVDAVTLDGTGHSYVQGANQNQDYNVAYGSSAGESVSANQAGSDGGVMSGTWTTSCPNSQVSTAFIPAGGGTDYTATVPGAAAASASGPTPTASSRPYVNTTVA
jgi:hypothetical protein